MTLKDLPIGKTATVTTVGGEGALRQHFLDMGLIPKADVTMVKFAPMGDPVEVRIHGYELTLRHMERVSRGLSGAIDTSALHLELQSLFNRVVGIIGSAASMDYGTPNDPEPQG